MARNVSIAQRRTAGDLAAAFLRGIYVRGDCREVGAVLFERQEPSLPRAREAAQVPGRKSFEPAMNGVLQAELLRESRRLTYGGT